MSRLTKRQVIDLLASPVRIVIGREADTSQLDDYGRKLIILQNGTQITVESEKHNCGAIGYELSINNTLVYSSAMYGCHQYNHQREEFIYSQGVCKVLEQKITMVYQSK